MACDANDSDDAIYLLRDKLQCETGQLPMFTVENFTNWAETRTIKPLFACRPRNLKEVQAVVKAARKHHVRVRCTGSGHSWSPLYPDEWNVLVRVSELTRHDGDRIELLQRDGHNYVTVSSGVSVKELERFELKHQVNLPCNVILTEPMWGGVISTGCHGTGWDCKALPDYVVKMRIVDSHGVLRTFQACNPENPNDPDATPELFKAVQTNLGLFGIIYDMTFDLPNIQIVKAENDFQFTANDLFYNPQKLRDLVVQNETVEIFWWPFNSNTRKLDMCNVIWSPIKPLSRKNWDPKRDELWVKTVNTHCPVDGEKVKGKNYYNQLDLKHWLEARGTNVAIPLLVHFPFLTPYFSQAAFHFLKTNTPKSITQQLPHAIHYRSSIDLIKVHDMECCFRINDNDFSVVTEACQSVIDIVKEDAKTMDYALNVAMEMRFMADSDSYLCPAYIGSPENGGTGHTFYLEVLSFTHTDGWPTFCNKVFQKWKKLDPSIHWAKEWELLDGGVEYMKQNYAAPGAKFVEQLNKANVDPDGMFRNKTLDKILFT